MHVLLKGTFSLTELVRKTEEHKENLIKNFKFIMALKTLGNQGLLNIPKMWCTLLI